MSNLQPVAKAVVSALVTAAVALIAVVGGNEGLSDVTLTEWLAVFVAVGGSFGVVYAVPNRPKQ